MWPCKSLVYKANTKESNSNKNRSTLLCSSKHPAEEHPPKKRNNSNTGYKYPLQRNVLRSIDDVLAIRRASKLPRRHSFSTPSELPWKRERTLGIHINRLAPMDRQGAFPVQRRPPESNIEHADRCWDHIVHVPISGTRPHSSAQGLSP